MVNRVFVCLPYEDFYFFKSNEFDWILGLSDKHLGSWARNRYATENAAWNQRFKAKAHTHTYIYTHSHVHTLLLSSWHLLGLFSDPLLTLLLRRHRERIAHTSTTPASPPQRKKRMTWAQQNWGLPDADTGQCSYLGVEGRWLCNSTPPPTTTTTLPPSPRAPGSGNSDSSAISISLKGRRQQLIGKLNVAYLSVMHNAWPPL